MKDYLQYTHTNISEDTISSFFDKNQAYLSDDVSLYDFLKYSGDTGKDNITRIFEKYSYKDQMYYSELEKIISGSSKKIVENRYSDIRAMPLNMNTELLIKSTDFNNQLISVRGKNLFLKQKDQVGFWSEKQVQILSDPLYVPSENMSFRGIGHDVEFVNQNVQVWIWCRAQNRIIDISPFIQSLTTNKSEVGSFTISLSPLEDWNKFYNLKTRDILNYFNVRETDGTIQTDFFHRNFQQNDIVFIRFEKLKLEDKYGQIPYYTFEIDKSKLPGQTWDMIGLLDSNEIDVNFSSIDYGINLSGRDFLKLLTEDGSYILNRAYIVGDQTNLIIGFNKDGKFFKRLYTSPDKSYNEFQYDFLYSLRSISDSVGFLVNQISNIGVLGGEDLFSQYQNRRTEAYSITGTEVGKVSPQLVDGVWQIIKFFVDGQLKDRIIADGSLAQSDGVLLEQFNKLCQDPFVEFYGDTYGDEFNFIVRQPPFSKKAVLGFLGMEVVSDSTLQLIEGDLTVKTEDIIAKGSKDFVIDIEEKDVERFSLNWDETYYAWYQIEPADGMLKESQNFASGGIIPIVMFEEIAEIFGNHRKVISDNYLIADFGNDKNSYRNALFNDLKYLIDTHFHLPFTRKGTITLVKGDRRIKKGTFIRLVQTGEIYYVNSVSNSLVFAGDNGAPNRTTTLQVSRGMIEEYISGNIGYDENGEVITDKGQEVKFCYFGIVSCNIENKSIIPESKIVKTPEKIKGGTPDIEKTAYQEKYTSKNIDKKTGYIKVGSRTERWRTLVQKYFPVNEVDNALRIIQAESTGNPKVKPNPNPPSIDKNGKFIPASHDWGLFQINDYWNSQYFGVGGMDIQDPEYNIQCAFKIWSAKNGGWKLWATSKIPGVINNGIIDSKLTEESSVTSVTEESTFNFKLEKEQWKFFLKRQQMNLKLYGK
jgi:hypothetical protein